MDRLRRRPSAQTIVTAAVVATAVLYTFAQLHPTLLFTNTTPSGGDMGAHVWLPAYLRDHLIHHGRLSGWTPDWYAGFPALTFYFPLPSILIVLLNVVLPYGVAFKLVSVVGLLALPVAAYAFGRLARLAFPGPALLGVATLPFMFDQSFKIWGGNIPSNLAGEFSFTIGLAISLVFLGLVARGLETGKYRALAPALLGLTALCHILPTLFAVVGAVVILLLRPSRRGVMYLVPTFVVAVMLGGYWIFPFYARLPYANDMGWEKLVKYGDNLFPHHLRWALALAAAGAISSLALWRRAGLALIGIGIVAALAFRYGPEGRLWNARFLPFWYLCIYLLAGLAVAEVSHAIASLFSSDPERPWTGAAFAAPIAGILAVLAAIGPSVERGRAAAHAGPSVFARLGTPVTAPLGWVLETYRQVAPVVDKRLPSKLRWMAPQLPKSTDSSFIPSWVRWNYTGYERKDAYPEYRALVDTMAKLPCGRAMWEYDSKLDRYGTPMALMLLPYWTHGCIGSMEGLYFESSATTPYHFLNQAELSKGPSNPQRDLPYHSLDVASGVRHLQLLGVRYYMVSSPEAKAQARFNPDLRLVARSATWEIYEIARSQGVAPLAFKPAVLANVPKKAKPWLDVSTRWYQDFGRWDIPLAASGPPDWQRVRVHFGPRTGKTIGSGVTLPDPTPQPVVPVNVTRIRHGDDRVSFDVDRPGSPVLVKTSYFPNWQASGARGPWRVTPNLMVVIPTSRHVSVHYGYTSVDRAGWALTFLGLLALVVLARRPPYADPPHAQTAAERHDERPVAVRESADGGVRRPRERVGARGARAAAK